MKRNLLDLSGKIDSLTLEILQAITKVAESLNTPFFVVGATARDIILEHGYGIPTKRATQDIDFGVQVSDWEHYRQLREGLISTGKFTYDKKKTQRLLHEGNFPVDIIPFGAIANLDNSISWPPDNEVEMSTLGFEESYHNALTVRVRSDPVLDVKFASLPGLALMKIISCIRNPLLYPPELRGHGFLTNCSFFQMKNGYLINPIWGRLSLKKRYKIICNHY